jgi:arabinose-5-phosphate isomerase
VVISYGGGGADLAGLLKFANRKSIPVIAMTGNLSSPLAQEAQVVLDISVEKEACPHDLAPTASSTATMALGDALAMVVMTQKGFKAEDFAEFHPGGALGFKLSRVRENMHTGRGFILAPANTPIKKLISLMSQAETRGAAGIINEQQELIGIVTDGDLRRRLESVENPLAGQASDMMSQNPRTIDAGEVAERALFLMEQFRINLLFVLDKSSSSTKVPVGIIHVQDLLRNKVR